ENSSLLADKALRFGGDRDEGLRLDGQHQDVDRTARTRIYDSADRFKFAFKRRIEVRLHDRERKPAAFAHSFDPAPHQSAAHGACAYKRDSWGFECAHASPSVSSNDAADASSADIPPRIKNWNAGWNRSAASSAAANMACTSPTEISSRPIIGMACRKM